MLMYMVYMMERKYGMMWPDIWFMTWVKISINMVISYGFMWFNLIWLTMTRDGFTILNNGCNLKHGKYLTNLDMHGYNLCNMGTPNSRLIYVNTSDYEYIPHKPYLQKLQTDLANYGAKQWRDAACSTCQLIPST